MTCTYWCSKCIKDKQQKCKKIVYLQHQDSSKLSRTTFADWAWRHQHATSRASTLATFCFGCGALPQTQDGLFPPSLFIRFTCCYLRSGPAKLRPPVRGWSGFRWLGLLWTPQFAHSEPGPPGSRRTPVYWLLLQQPRLQPVKVSISDNANTDSRA